MKNLLNILIMLAIVAITAAMTIGHGAMTRPVLADDQLYFYLAERCASGVPPHVSQYEVKTQLPTMIGGAAIAAGRRVAALIDYPGESATAAEPGSEIATVDVLSERLATTVFAAVAVVFAWLLAFELTGSEGAALVATGAMFSIYGLFLEAATGFQPKLFMITFAMAAHLWCARRRPLLTGIAGMAAFLCWQPALFVLAGCGLASLLDRRATWKSVVVLIAGALMTFAAYEAWFAWHGALGEQIRQEFALAFGSQAKAFDWKESVWFVLTEAQTFRTRPDGLPSLFVAATALLWIAALARPRRAWEIVRENPGRVAFWTTAHLTTAFTLYDHQAHPDMLLVQPYFAVSCGIASAWVTSVLLRLRRGRILAGVVTVVFVLLGLWDAEQDVWRARFGRIGFQKEVDMAKVTDLYFDHFGSVWVVGSVHLLALEHRDNWVPVGNVGRETADRDMGKWRPLKDGRMPDIIIAGRGLRPGFSSWLPLEYLDITPAIFANDRIRVFSRISSDHAGFQKGNSPTPAPGPAPPPRPQAVKPAAPAKAL